MVLQVNRYTLFQGTSTLHVKAGFRILECRADYDNPELIVLEDVSCYDTEGLTIVLVSEGETIYHDDIAYLGSLAIGDQVLWAFRVMS